MAKPLCIKAIPASSVRESTTKRGPESLAGRRPSRHPASLDWTEERSG